MKKRLFILGICLIMGNILTSPAMAKEVCLGECCISAYSPETNTPANSRQTSTGHRATENHTIAVDMRDPLCNYGAKLRIEGSNTVYTVEDCGNLLHYGRDLDLFVGSKEETLKWGVRYKKVYLVLPDKKPRNERKPKRGEVSKPQVAPFILPDLYSERFLWFWEDFTKDFQNVLIGEKHGILHDYDR